MKKSTRGRRKLLRFKIGLDIGYGHTKVGAEDGIWFIFPQLQERGFHRPRQPIETREDYIARINNTTWYVGEMARKESTFYRAFEQADRYNDFSGNAVYRHWPLKAQIKTLC